MGDVTKIASRVLAVQIDSINVLVRSHYLPAYSRLGAYPMATIDRLAYERRELFEGWTHATCLLPVRLYPLLRHRMTALRDASPWTPGRTTPASDHIQTVYEAVAEHGPLTAGELPGARERRGKWWGWSDGKLAIEYLLACGLVAVAGRRNFERLYDLTERVLPQEALDAPAPGPEQAQKELLCLSARALGVATADQLGGYLGLHSPRALVRGPDGKRPKRLWPGLLRELVEDGRLASLRVEGWTENGYALPDARIPKSMDERALLSPFDSFMRGPARVCCGFTQHLAQQLYVPAERRVFGYYVLPFLLGDTLVGRCDLKADRQRNVLMVQGAFVEDGQEPTRVASELAAELRFMQAWLELASIEVADRGELAPLLRRSL
ncbi:MAG TPA: crosslink repair DNA glycosylase YcaQ family protein [Candidatus Dormibacteraeota bacterium]|nr:crosslink repair DNA glycosylase YcaQ family protein [Candidatus Dormibacteraeota bacterium]